MLHSTTFSVYLYREMFLNAIGKAPFALDSVTYAIPASFAWVVVTLAIGAALTLVLKKVPIIKKFI